MRYAVFQFSGSGTFTKAGDLEASSDTDALKQARQMLASGVGELRQDLRIVCRFGRTEPFLLRE